MLGTILFQFHTHVGRTDGKGVEQNWSRLNGVARCVSIMGSGGCADTLDDFYNYHNWRKTIGLGESSNTSGTVDCHVTSPLR